MKQNRIVMSLEQTTIDKIQSMAKGDGRKVSDFIHQIIKSYLKFKTKQRKSKKE